MLENYNQTRTKKIFKVYNEISVFVTFESFRLKVRPDRLILYEDGSFEIIDLKTTSTSVSNMMELSRVMENLKYPLSAAMYTHLVHECYDKSPGIFSLAWICKDTGMCAMHEGITTTEPVETFGWNHVGFTTYCEALRRYSQGITLLKNAIGKSKRKEDIIRPYFDIRTVPSPWTEKQLFQSVAALNETGARPFFEIGGVGEVSVKNHFDRQFRELPKPVSYTHLTLPTKRIV